MSVTAPKGFVASGIAAGIRRDGRADLAIVRSVPHTTGGAMFTRNRVQAACVQVSRDHISLADPQAVVVNSGCANAATGERGKIDALATAAEAARLLDVDLEEVLVLSTGVIGARLPIHKLLPGLADAVAALAENGGHNAAGAIMTTDTYAKETVISGPGFVVGGMAKGSGMIHPELATMLAVLTTDYPLAPGESIDYLRPAVDPTFNAISVDGEPSTNDTVVLLANGASGVERTPETDAAFGVALLAACDDLPRQVVADGEGITVLAEINVRGRCKRRAGEGDRAPDRDVAARENCALRPRRQLGPSADGGRVGALERRLRRDRRQPGDPPLQRHGRARPGRTEWRRTGCRGAELHDRARSRPRQRERRVSHQRPLLRLRQDQRGLPVVSRIVVKVGGAVAGASAGAVLELAETNEVCVVHGAGPQISAEMTRAGIPVEFIGGRRVTSEAGIVIVRSSLAAVNAALCEALGERAVPLFGDEIGLQATPIEGLGLAGDPSPSRPIEVIAALDAGLIPVVAPIAAGPLNVNADEAAAALALGIGADQLLFLTDVDGLLMEGAVVDSIDVAAATALLDGGSLEGGIIPKLHAAVTAARDGVPAWIGKTAVTE